MCLLIGIFVSEVTQYRRSGKFARLAAWTPTLLFGWFAVPLILFGYWNTISLFLQAKAEQTSFREQVAFIKSSDGPALCESLLRCYVAGKPYIYDPFNATRLIRLGKLNDDQLVADVRNRHYAVIELSDPVGVELGYRSEHFTKKVLAAVEQSYVLIYQRGRESIYKPR